MRVGVVAERHAGIDPLAEQRLARASLLTSGVQLPFVHESDRGRAVPAQHVEQFLCPPLRRRRVRLAGSSKGQVIEGQRYRTGRLPHRQTPDVMCAEREACQRADESGGGSSKGARLHSGTVTRTAGPGKLREGRNHDEYA